MKKKRLYLTALITGSVFARAESIPEQRPNVILVMTDDQGYGDLSFYGNPRLQTPNLDQLGHNSVRLADYHVSPTCAPTRAALMTGRYSNRTGVWHTINGRSILRENEVTLADVLRSAGYRTGIFGKWHLGDNYPSRPQDRGFDETYCFGGGGVGQTPDYWNNAYFNDHYFHNGKVEPAEGFCTDVFFDRAIQFIRKEHQANHPFFVYLAPNAPHSPFHCPEKYSAPYSDLGEKLANFFGMIANIDWNMGRLQNVLEENGLSENTILIFTTDNGSAAGWEFYNAGMREGKGSEYDGGHRVPFFISWPAGGLSGGRDVRHLTAHVDILPTLIDLLNLPAPDGVHFDGTSLAPLLKQSQADWPHRTLVTDSQRIHLPEKWKQSAVMTDRWRLINGRELYDMHTDPGQHTDCSANYPETVADLRESYEQWWNSMKASFTDNCEIVLGNESENPSVLTAHDWMLKEGYPPWNQQQIRKMAHVKEGSWAVEMEQAGTYRIKLYRWPPEANHPIVADLPPGSDVPGTEAWRTEPGKGFPAVEATLEVAGKKRETNVAPDSISADFELELPAGITRLKGVFVSAANDRLGSYYAVVERL